MGELEHDTAGRQTSEHDTGGRAAASPASDTASLASDAICGGLSEQDLLALGADLNEARAVARFVGADVRELVVTAAGYLTRTHAGGETLLPHGWMRNAVGGAERPTRSDWCSGCGRTRSCDQCRRARGVVTEVVHCLCREAAHAPACPVRDVMTAEEMGPAWIKTTTTRRRKGRDGWESYEETTWAPPPRESAVKTVKPERVAPIAVPLEAFEVIVLDTETTGTGRDARIVELAAARVDVHSGRVIERRGMLLDPGCPIPRDASQVHGITDAMVRGKPTLGQVWSRVMAFAGDLPIVAHHAVFDRSRLEFEIERQGLDRPGWRWWCSIVSARRAIPGQPTYSLQPLAKALGLRAGTAHRAMGDVLTTAALLHHCALRAGRWSVWAGPAPAVWDEREAARGLFGATGGAA